MKCAEDRNRYIFKEYKQMDLSFQLKKLEKKEN